ncbi:hypothetical protein [Desertivirga xinjiangensis]|uniref:hypothetical protein n=1 Tax=Desertivirga xinjiangensis TaxID=539206 RepID=UPI00210AF786|nr:hypothetical protein [Pedobacter xinjiangensis]
MDHTDKPQQDEVTRHTPANTPTVSRKTFYIAILIALLLIVGLWIWKSIETSNLRKNAETKQNSLRQEAKGLIVQAHEQHLKLLAKPFVWAVRTEMMQGNMSQVNLYMNEMVKEKNFQRIALINDKGIIVSSTNKKDEGKPFSTIGNNSDLAINSTNVQTQQDSLISMTSPVMGFNNRLGTLFIRYNIPKAEFQQ